MSSEHSGKGRVVNFFSSERVYPNTIKTIEKPSYTISSNVILDNPPSKRKIWWMITHKTHFPSHWTQPSVIETSKTKVKKLLYKSAFFKIVFGRS